MATYNGALYIEDQLKSILPQLQLADEVIVVDDASQDNTLEIINDVRDARIRLIRHEVNQGVLATFERAIRAASGQFIFLSDQDDLWAPEKVDTFIAAFESHPEAKVIISDAEIIGESAEVLELSNFAERPFRSGLLANLLHSRFIGCMMAFRSTLVPSVLPFPHGLDVLHDIWIGTANSVSGGTTFFIDRPLTMYRRHGGNMTGVRRLPRHRQIRLRVDLLLALGNLYFRRMSTRANAKSSSEDL
jgi:glycosyltransferase involved in cell wall biosynthesis